MRKTGLQMLLSQLGIEIDPQEIMTKYNEAKEIMPKLAVFVNQLDARLARIEERLGTVSNCQHEPPCADIVTHNFR